MHGILRNDIPIAIQDDNVELRLAELGDMTIAFVKLKKGTDLGDALAGYGEGDCPCPHWGYMLRGRLKMRTRHGDEVYEAGQAFYWEPGHIPVALEDCEYVDFSPTEEFLPVIDFLRGGGKPSVETRPGVTRM